MITQMSITINGTRWKVFKTDSHSPGLIADGDTCRGTCWCGDLNIFLSNELTRATAGRTIRHELAHAWIYTTQAAIPETWSEEDVCELIAIYAQDIAEVAQYVLDVLWPEEVHSCSNCAAEGACHGKDSSV